MRMDPLLSVLLFAVFAEPARAFREGYNLAGLSDLNLNNAGDANANANSHININSNQQETHTDTGTDTQGNNNNNQLPVLTFLKLKVPAGAEVTALPEDARTPRSTSQLQEAEAAGTVTKGFPEELAWFKKYKAVREQWANTLTTQKPSWKSIGILNEVKTWEVPGLKGTTFAEVFKKVQQKCPLWIVGGGVRDLVVGNAPNDIDCIALCDTSKVAEVAVNMGWKHHYRKGAAYFAIGDVHGDNPNYLEGFSGDLLFGSSDMAEMTTSILLWGLSTNTIVDPSGKGVNDAKNMLLRPAVPDEGMTGRELWKARRKWLFGGFSGPRLARHVRYLKMRMRGWKPADECVRTFMANTIAAMSLVERLTKEDMPGLVQAFGDIWPFLPGATLEMLIDKFRTENKLKQTAAVHSLVQVYEEDMTDYLAGKTTGSCGKDWTPDLVVNEKSHDVSFIPHSVKDLLSPTVRECRKLRVLEPTFYPDVKYLCSAAESYLLTG